MPSTTPASAADQGGHGDLGGVGGDDLGGREADALQHPDPPVAGHDGAADDVDDDQHRQDQADDAERDDERDDRRDARVLLLPDGQIRLRRDDGAAGQRPGQGADVGAERGRRCRRKRTGTAVCAVAGLPGARSAGTSAGSTQPSADWPTELATPTRVSTGEPGHAVGGDVRAELQAKARVAGQHELAGSLRPAAVNERQVIEPARRARRPTSVIGGAL